jgi:hypothetical protein
LVGTLATLTTVVIAVALILSRGIGTQSDPPRPRAAPSTAHSAPSKPPAVHAYEPSPDEPYRNGKRLAGRIAQRLATYQRDAETSDVAAAALDARASAPVLRRLASLVVPHRRSWAEVVYVQLSGVSATSLGAMVILRQRTEDPSGKRDSVTRVLDIRLRRSGGPWSFAGLGSVGGAPVVRPVWVAPDARRVLDDSRIWLSDTARWDIYRGGIDTSLLRRLVQIATSTPISVSVLRTGHPERVWGTERRSAHSLGAAADIYAVGGMSVVRQRRAVGSAAHQLASELVQGRARQVGSPWVFAPGGKRSFTDAVHQDHIHLQQTARGAAGASEIAG